MGIIMRIGLMAIKQSNSPIIITDFDLKKPKGNSNLKKESTYARFSR